MKKQTNKQKPISSTTACCGKRKKMEYRELFHSLIIFQHLCCAQQQAMCLQRAVEVGGRTEVCEVLRCSQGKPVGLLQLSYWLLETQHSSRKECTLGLAIRSLLGKSGPGKTTILRRRRGNNRGKEEKRWGERKRKWEIMASFTTKEMMEPTYSSGVLRAKYETCGFPQCPIWTPGAESNFIEGKRDSGSVGRRGFTCFLLKPLC